MFEKEIKFIVDFNLNKIRKSGTFFTLDKISSAGIHPSILKYISAELDLMIFEDRKRLLNNSMFDYTGKEIARHFSMITREIKRNKRIEFEDLKKLVIQAVSFNANHVVRPRWSLSKLIFDPAPTRTVEEISLILEYPYYYSYTRNILLSYLTKKKITSLSITEFEEIYTKIDNELFAGGNNRLLDNALSSMSDFFNDGAASKDKLSPEVVLVFLKEKGLSEFSHRLRQSASPDAKQKYNLNEIRSIIYAGAVPIEPISHHAKEPEPEAEEEENLNKHAADDIINSIEEAPGEESQTEDTYVKVVSTLPIHGGELNIEKEEELPPAEDNIINKSEEEIAEEINLPIIKDTEPLEEEKVEETELPSGEPQLEEEVLHLPDQEIEEILKDEPEKEITTDEVVTDQDEIKFDLEAKDKLEELYEFEEEKEKPEPDPLILDNFPGLEEQDFNLNELENELKQIEEEFNIPDGPLPSSKEAKKSAAQDIFKFLTDRDIDRIITHIFNEDRDDFTNTLERISECRTYEESTEILKGVFLTYRINPYSRDAVNLTNAVSKYFDKK